MTSPGARYGVQQRQLAVEPRPGAPVQQLVPGSFETIFNLDLNGDDICIGKACRPGRRRWLFLGRQRRRETPVPRRRSALCWCRRAVPGGSYDIAGATRVQVCIRCGCRQQRLSNPRHVFNNVCLKAFETIFKRTSTATSIPAHGATSRESTPQRRGKPGAVSAYSPSIAFSSSTPEYALTAFTGVISSQAAVGSDQIDKGIKFNSVHDNIPLNGILTVTDGTDTTGLQWHANFKFASSR